MPRTRNHATSKTFVDKLILHSMFGMRAFYVDVDGYPGRTERTDISVDMIHCASLYDYRCCDITIKRMIASSLGLSPHQNFVRDSFVECLRSVLACAADDS